MKKDHPTITAVREKPRRSPTQRITLEQIRKIARECGADDVGAVSIDRPELEGERSHIVHALPGARAIICIVKKMLPAPIRAPQRSLANHEFHLSTVDTSEIARRIVVSLDAIGVSALATSPGFPMELANFPGRTWVVSHKVVAEAAGLGKMGIHRNLIHPIFGSFVLLDSILIEAQLEDESSPIDYNPCVECKLCVAACPVGAISADGHFDSVACLNHNYREFMGGFIDWVDTVADSRDSKTYQSKVTDSETASLWQSLSFGANYKSAYCMAACPAGEDIIGRFLGSKPKFVAEVLKPLQEKVEPVYVVAGSDAEAHARKRFPHKIVRLIRSGVRPNSIEKLVEALPLAFQRGRSEGIEVRYHFIFTGTESREATFVIKDQKFDFSEGLLGSADLKVIVDSEAWIDFLAKRATLVRLLVTRKLRFSGDLRRLELFARCFPS